MIDRDNAGAKAPGEDTARDEVEFDLEDAEGALAQDEDTRLAENDDQDDDDGDEGERDAARQARRRASRKRQRERRREFWNEGRPQLDALTRENEQLKRRLEAIEGRALEQERQSVEQQLNVAKHRFTQAEREMKEAVETGDGDRLIKATRSREQAALEIRQYDNMKRQASAPAPRPDPAVQRMATEWVDDNPWFDASGRDLDSKIVLEIDGHLVRSGMDPTSKDYWQTLDDEVRKRLPHRFSDDDDGDYFEDRRGPPIGGRGEPARPSTVRREKVYLTPERRQALEALGVWGDREAMKPFLQEYAAFDRQNRRTR